jgi:hypothetical protein
MTHGARPSVATRICCGIIAKVDSEYVVTMVCVGRPSQEPPARIFPDILSGPPNPGFTILL